MVKGVILYNDRVVISRRLRREIFEVLRAGHLTSVVGFYVGQGY